MGIFDRFSRKQRSQERPEPSSMPDVDPERSPFGYKTGWVAVQSGSADHVAGSLGLVDRREASWQEGVATAYSKGVFVCPSVDGWILAMGEGVLAGGVDAAALSERIGSEVQVFKTHRVVELHAWARAEEGVLTRDFEFLGESGEIVKNVGSVTPAEEDEASAADCASLAVGPVPFDDEGLDFPTEETVMAIAAAWSLDPTTLGGPDDRLGVLGRLR